MPLEAALSPNEVFHGNDLRNSHVKQSLLTGNTFRLNTELNICELQLLFAKVLNTKV